jgi:hypothetical protein
MKNDLESTLDELIDSLKEINLSYESLMSSNERLFQGVKRIAVAQDSKEALVSVQKVLFSLDKLAQTIELIQEGSQESLSKKEKEEVQEYFDQVISKETLQEHTKKVQGSLSTLKKFFYFVFILVTVGVFVGFLSMYLKIRQAIERKRII